MGRTLQFACAFAVLGIGAFFLFRAMQITPPQPVENSTPVTLRLPAAADFDTPLIVYEAGSMEESSSEDWWVSSGGMLLIEAGIGKTNQGRLAPLERFRVLYAAMNPLDTDDGFTPQNTFRLVSRSLWEDVRLSALFRIVDDNLIETPQRNASNGLLFMSRYQDSDTLYYAGVRVDGTAVIKKKYRGTYYTMAQTPVFDGTYDSVREPNLLPHNADIPLMSETITRDDGSVLIRLFMQRADGTWDPILEARDDGRYGGTPPILGRGHAGIRTDFMDVEFADVRIESL